MNNEKLIEEIVAMLDGSVQRGDGHINVNVEENLKEDKEVVRGTADCSVNPMACSVPTIELPGDEEFQK